MSHVVCLMDVKEDRATFTWSEGPASFEPYTLDGMVYKDFKEIAAEARERLADLVKDYLSDEQRMPASAFALAAAGHELYQAMFQPGAEQARQAKQVRTWLENLAQQREVDTLEIVVESPWSLPWNIIYDQEPDKADFLSAGKNSDHWKPFWGLRYNLAGGRKVDPLRRMPLLDNPKVLMVVDPEIRDGLPAAQQQRLADFAESHQFKIAQNKDELQAAIKAGRPDLLYWLSHASADALVLGDDEVSPRNMRKLLQQDDYEKPGGLAFLNACQTAEGGASGSFFEAFHNVGFAGMIGTEHQTVDQFANPLGLDFLEAFLDRGEPVGSTLRKLRGRVPLGLLYGTYCPPDIRVDCGDGHDSLDIHQVHVPGIALSVALESPEAATRKLPPLPADPYRSLAFYDREDRALFAGRDDDTERFARMLDDASTRMLVLHGESGVGKSSFLHAGVIPYLEDECLGYRFMRNWEGDKAQQTAGSVLFVRATNDLFGQLAQALCDYCARPYEYETPTGECVSADLPGVLGELIGDEVNQASLRAVLRSDPALLGRILSAISDRLPFTAILVIDQGEEIFTLAQTPEDQQRGQQALDMLRKAVGASGNFKVIFALRTEYYGRVIDRLRRGMRDTGSIREYLLTDFDEKDLLEAIRRPTAEKSIPNSSEVPFKKYGFRYGKGVAEKISERVIHYTTQRRDSVLPLMQVICAQLYREVSRRDDKTITLGDLETLGGIAGGMRHHVDESLKRLLEGRPLDKRPLQKLFTQLYLKQPDGTLTTALLAEDEVEKRWTGHMPFDKLLDSAVAMRLLKVNTLRIGSAEEQRYVSLGHDALAKIAADWNEQLSRGARMRKMATAMVSISAFAIFMFVMALFAWNARGEAVQAKNDAVKDKEKAEIAQCDAIHAQGKAEDQRAIAENQKAIAEDLADEARLRKKAALVEALLPKEPVTSLVLAIEATEKSKLKFSEVLPHVESSLLKAIQAAEWSNLLRLPDDSVTSIAISSDGKAIVSISRDGSIKLWDTDGHPIGNVFGDHRSITSLATTPEGQAIIVGSDDGELRIWKRDNNAFGKPLNLTGHSGKITALAIAATSEGEMIVSGSDVGGFSLWRPGSGTVGEPLMLVGQSGKVTALAIAVNKKEKTIVSGSNDGTVRLWDNEGKPVGDPLAGHGGSIASVAISSDGRTIVSGGHDGSVRMWDRSGKPLGTPKWLEGGIASVAISRNGKTIICGNDVGTVWFFPVGNDAMKKTLMQIESVALGRNDLTSITVSLDGKTIVGGCEDGTMRLWDQTGSAIARIIDDRRGRSILRRLSITSVAISRDGKIIVAGSDDGIVRMWNRDGKAIGRPWKGHTGRVTSVAISQDGNTIVSGSDDETLRLWSPDGKVIGEPRKHDHEVVAVAISPDGKTIVSGSDDGGVRLWDRERNSVGITLRGHDKPVTCIAISRDGKTIVSGSEDKSIRLWNLQKSISKTLRGHDKKVTSVAFSPDPEQKYIVSGGVGGTVRLWDRNGQSIGNPFKPFVGRSDVQEITAGSLAGDSSNDVVVAFKSDADTVDVFEIVALSRHNREVWAWPVGTDKWLQTACQKVRYHDVLVEPGNELAQKIAEESGKETVGIAANTCLEFDDWNAEEKAEFLVRQGRALARAGMVPEALDKFDKATDRNSSIDIPTRAQAQRWAAPAMVRLGRQLAQEGDVQKAIAIFQEAQHFKPDVDFDPETVETEKDFEEVAKSLAVSALVYRGYELAWQGNVGEATDAFSEALELDPKVEFELKTKDDKHKFFSNLKRGWEGFWQGPPYQTDAQTVANQLAARGKVWIGSESAQDGNIHEAIAAYQEAQGYNPEIDLNPATPKLESDPESVANDLAALSRRREGFELAQDGNVKDAIAAFEKAQEYNPEIDLNPETPAIEHEPILVANELANIAKMNAKEKQWADTLLRTQLVPKNSEGLSRE